MRLPTPGGSGGGRWGSPSALQGTGVIRMLIGGGMLLQPERSLRSMGLDSGTASRAAFVARMLGARDAALGAGLVHAVRRGSDPLPWLLAQAVSDAVDLVGFLDARRRGLIGTKPAIAAALAASSGVFAETKAVRALRG